MFSNRLQSLEKKILVESGKTPAVVYEMKQQVESFREKLEVNKYIYAEYRWSQESTNQILKMLSCSLIDQKSYIQAI